MTILIWCLQNQTPRQGFVCKWFIWEESLVRKYKSETEKRRGPIKSTWMGLSIIYMRTPWESPWREYKEQNRSVSLRKRKLGCFTPTLVSRWMSFSQMPWHCWAYSTLYGPRRLREERKSSYRERHSRLWWMGKLQRDEGISDRVPTVSAKITWKGVEGVDTTGCFYDCSHHRQSPTVRQRSWVFFPLA